MFRHLMFLFQLLCMNTELVHSPDTIVNDSFSEKEIFGKNVCVQQSLRRGNASQMNGHVFR